MVNSTSSSCGSADIGIVPIYHASECTFDQWERSQFLIQLTIHSNIDVVKTLPAGGDGGLGRLAPLNLIEQLTGGLGTGPLVAQIETARIGKQEGQ